MCGTPWPACPEPSALRRPRGHTAIRRGQPNDCRARVTHPRSHGQGIRGRHPDIFPHGTAEPIRGGKGPTEPRSVVTRRLEPESLQPSPLKIRLKTLPAPDLHSTKTELKPTMDTVYPKETISVMAARQIVGIARTAMITHEPKLPAEVPQMEIIILASASRPSTSPNIAGRALAAMVDPRTQNSLLFRPIAPVPRGIFCTLGRH